MKLEKLEEVLQALSDHLRTGDLLKVHFEDEDDRIHCLRIGTTQIHTSGFGLLIKEVNNSIFIPREGISQFYFEQIGDDAYVSIKTRNGVELCLLISSEKGWV